jgi:hypothetical protein
MTKKSQPCRKASHEVDLTQFRQALAQIDPARIAAEILDWMAANVMEYVDNSQNLYRIYFTGDFVATCPMAGALHGLYGSLPAESEHDSCTIALQEAHAVVGKAQQAMREDKSRLERLFQELIVYYDTRLLGFQGQGKVTTMPIIEPRQGYVEVVEFLYEPFQMSVVLRQKTEVQHGELVELAPEKQKEIKRTTVTEGYCLEIELHHWRADRPPTSVSLL